MGSYRAHFFVNCVRIATHFFLSFCMSFIEIVAIAVALSIDAVVVALCWSAGQKHIRYTHVFQFALVFGGFQALMPVGGWFAGEWLIHYISAFDHWVAFLLLLWVAYSMVKEALEGNEEDEACCGHCQGKKEEGISWWTLTVLAVATSLDALAVGFSFAMVQTPILMPAITIGVICAVLTTMAVSAGKALAQKVQRHTDKLSFVGAAVLLLIGLRILWEHGVFS